MKMKTFIRTAALLVTAAVATPAFAGGVTIAQKDDSKLKLEAKVFMGLTDYKKTFNTTALGVLKNGKNKYSNTRTRSASLDRAYLGIKYYFDSDWMMRITYDVNNESKAKTNAGLGKTQQVFLKYAYLEGKLMGDAVVLRLGQSHTPWIDYEQGLWKHRYVSKVMSDTYGYDSSSQLGLGLKGKVDMFHYFATVTDGKSYSSAQNFKGGSTGLDYKVRVGLTPIEGLTVDAQFNNGFNGTKSSTNSGTRQTFNQFMVTYGMGHDFRVGANYMSDKRDVLATNKRTKSDAIGVWGWVNITDKIGAYARLEEQKNKSTLTATQTAQKVKRYVLGAEYSPRKNVKLSLAIDNAKTTNLGNVTNASETARRYGLFSEFKF
ncbi:MAG: hypothetical protein Q9M14_02830 [Mariprofundaceae bacterium]|nr:hypothetical protein [Mariprofundaceae bacterium]